MFLTISFDRLLIDLLVSYSSKIWLVLLHSSSLFFTCSIVSALSPTASIIHEVVLPLIKMVRMTTPEV